MSEDVIVFEQFSRSVKAKEFLNELFGYHDSSDKQYSKERIVAFWSIVQRVLEPEEEQLIFQLLHDVKQKEALDDRERFLYELAVAKLSGDIVKINQLRTSKEADKYLPPASSRLTHVKEELKYANAKQSLKRIQEREKGPWIVGQIWL